MLNKSFQLRLLVSWALVLPGCGGGEERTTENLGGAGESCAKAEDCRSGLTCVAFVCQQPGADCPEDKDCSGLECGPDPVCGQSCGTCGTTETCQAGQCGGSGAGDTYSPPGGAWTDPVSGLTWQVIPTGGTVDWSIAAAYCAGMSPAGTWRLPDIGELRSLIRGCPSTELGSASCGVKEGGCLSSSCLDLGAGLCEPCPELEGPADGCYWPDEMQGTCGGYYWSSSEVSDLEVCVWELNYAYGGLSYDVNTVSGVSVRCVR